MTADKTARENNNGQEKHRGTAKETAKVTRHGGDDSYETDTPAQKEWPQAQARQGMGSAARGGRGRRTEQAHTTHRPVPA